jgi:hypothetical protein
LTTRIFEMDSSAGKKKCSLLLSPNPADSHLFLCFLLIQADASPANNNNPLDSEITDGEIHMDVSGDAAPASSSAAAATPTPAAATPKQPKQPEIVIPVDEYKSFYTSQQPPVEASALSVAYFEGLCNKVSVPAVDFEGIIDQFQSAGVIDASTVLFVDGTVMGGNCMLPPPKIKDYSLVHWFLVERVRAPAMSKGAVASPSSSTPAVAVPPAAGAQPVDGDAPVPDAAAVVDSAAAVDVPVEDAIAVGTTEDASSSSKAAAAAAAASRIVYPSSELSSVVGISQNKPYGFTRYNVIGVYAVKAAAAAAAAATSESGVTGNEENVLSCYGSNLIDVPQGRNATRCILDHISLYCRSTGGRVLVRISDGSARAVNYSGWAQIVLQQAAGEGFSAKTINMTQVRRALNGFVARNGVLKMDAYLQRHKSLSQARRALAQWARYSEHNVDKALKVWTLCSTNPESCLFGWPQPMANAANPKYESLAFTDVYKLIRSAVVKRSASAADGAASAAAAAAGDDDSAAVPATPHIPKSSRLARQRSKAGADKKGPANDTSGTTPLDVEVAAPPAKKAKRVPTASQMATILKPVQISQGLIDFISIHCNEADKLKDGNTIDRPTFHQVLWRYIHAHNLQPSKGSFVYPDEVLKQIFQIPPNEPQDKVKTFTMSRYLEWNFLGTKKRKRQEELELQQASSGTQEAPAAVADVAA